MTIAREAYSRTYWVVRSGLPEARRYALYAEAAKRQITVGPSFDDAGIGEGLASRTAVLWDVAEADKRELIDWFIKFYPGTIVQFAGKGDTKPPDPIPPPTGGRSLKMGLHTAASGQISAFDQFDMLQPKWIKVMSNQDIEGITRLAREHDATFIIRAYLDFWENDNPRKVFAVKFHEWTRDSLSAIFNVLNAHGRRYIVECHNEPNLVREGMMRDGDNHPTDPGSWCAGHQFNTWIHEWRRAFQIDFGTRISLMTPGLSPGGSVANMRADSNQFYREMAQAISNFGHMGIHCYWSDEAPLHLAIAELNDLRQQYPGVPKYITEFSHNKPADLNKKAGEIAAFVRAIEKMPDVMGATAFVAADPHAMFVNENWQVQGMARRVRSVMGY